MIVSMVRAFRRAAAPRAGALLLVLASVGTSASANTAAAPADDGRVQRFALIVGANDGGAERVRLRYAGSDARAFATVMQELGGIAPENRMLLNEPDVDTLRTALSSLGAAAAAAHRQGKRTELVVYYSGHADEEGLLLAGAKLPYAELRRQIADVSADVHIAVIDSCASGAFVRLKGGTRGAPFLLDASSQVKGHAFLASSSDSEVAQESDRIGASYFTHYLVSGLRGAADLSGDNRVTLTEAYQFAYHETLARTETSLGGAQHPAYDIQLSGSGDLVLTDLRNTSATLALSEDLQGRMYVRDMQGRLVLELNKTAGREIELGLEPGRYRVVVDSDGQLRQGEFELGDGQRTVLTPAQLTAVTPEVAVSRGATVPTGAPTAADEVVLQQRFPVVRYGDASYVHVPVAAALTPRLSNNAPGRQPLAQPVANNFAFNVLGGYGDRLDGLELGFGLSWRGRTVNGVQWSMLGNLVKPSQKREANYPAGVSLLPPEMTGLQASWGFNWVEGQVRGVQATSGLNFAHSVKGVQGASGVNYARAITGAQWGSLNIAKQVKGAQLGLLNVGRQVKGLQLGLINYADDVQGAPIGLLSIVRNGRHELMVLTGDVMPLTLGLRLGAQRFYNIFEFGMRPEPDKDRVLLSGGYGFGIGMVTAPVLLDLELVGHQLKYSVDVGDNYDEVAALAQVRLMATWPLRKQLALVAGLTLNVLVEYNDTGAPNRHPIDRPTYLRWESQRLIDDAAPDYIRTQIWPGFMLGIQI